MRSGWTVELATEQLGEDRAAEQLSSLGEGAEALFAGRLREGGPGPRWPLSSALAALEINSRVALGGGGSGGGDVVTRRVVLSHEAIHFLFSFFFHKFLFSSFFFYHFFFYTQHTTYTLTLCLIMGTNSIGLSLIVD